MAVRVFLGSGDSFTAASNNLSITGASGAGTESVLINSGITGTTLDANVERVDVAGNLADYKFVFIAGTGFQIQSSTGTVIGTIPSLNQNTTVAFADGSATLSQTGASTFTLGGQTVTTSTAAAITSTSMGTGFNTSIKSGVAGTSGTGGTTQTQTFTTNIDNLTGTSGDDTFIGDNSGSTSTVTAGDQLNGGAGNDTFKFYLKSTDTAITMPQVSSIENLYVYGGAVTAFTASNVAGVNNVEFDAQGANFSLTLAGTQTAKFSNDNGTVYNETLIYGSSDTSGAVVLNGVGKVGVGTAATVDIQGAAFNTLNLTANSPSATAIDNISLTNSSGVKLATLNISGDKTLLVAEALPALKTINASTASGNVTIDQSALGTDNALTFTGGAGNDKVIFKQGYLTTVDVLDGGAGTDTLVINDTTPVYTAINAAKNFEVLALATTGATVDATQITNGINQFAVAAGNLTETFNNTNSTSKFAIDLTGGNTGTVTIANKVGETSTTIAVDNQAGSAQTLSTLTLTGVTTVALSSTGKLGSANTITTLNNADNSAITVTGGTDLTFGLKATTVGSKVDASAFTGKLAVTGNTAAFAAGSSLGDILIGGSGDDTLKAAINGGTLTGNGGKDVFDVSAAKGGTTNTAGIVNITDLTKGDSIKVSGTAFTAVKVDLSSVNTSTGTIGQVLDILAAGNASGVKWGQWNGNTYAVDDVGAGATFAATDIAVKITGLVDLSTSTFAANTLAYA